MRITLHLKYLIQSFGWLIIDSLFFMNPIILIYYSSIKIKVDKPTIHYVIFITYELIILSNY